MFQKESTNCLKVSVIIPVYNVEQYLRQCLDSVVQQTLSDIEIICIDDGSSDKSLAILQDYANRDKRIIVLTQKNSGAGAARNKGLSIAKGKYLSFLDSDDFFELDMLEKAFEKAEEEHAEIVVFRADLFNTKNNEYVPYTNGIRYSLLPQNRPFAAEDIQKDIFKVVIGWAWDKIFLRSFIEKNKLLFQEQRTTNDAFFVFCALVKAKRITTCDLILVHQRRFGGGTLSVTREKSWKCFYNALYAIRNQLKEWNLYERFEQDFINYSLHFSLWNLNTLKEPTKALLLNKLQKEWFKELGICSHNESFFYNKYEYRQYLNIMKGNKDSFHAEMNKFDKFIQCYKDYGLVTALEITYKYLRNQIIAK